MHQSPYRDIELMIHNLCGPTEIIKGNYVMHKKVIVCIMSE